MPAVPLDEQQLTINEKEFVIHNAARTTGKQSLHASVPPGLETIAASANPLTQSTADLDDLGSKPAVSRGRISVAGGGKAGMGLG